MRLTAGPRIGADQPDFRDQQRNVSHLLVAPPGHLQKQAVQRTAGRLRAFMARVRVVVA
ncbi:hypothetical protein ACFU9X_25900 [Streptomyces atratus]|uniref:hypothetical protein n=1 Tax=Streptomyces atratus TaxID=1893 RepID=UPI0036CD7E1A